MNDKTGKIILEGDTLYRLDYWTKVFNEPRGVGAERNIALGLDTLELNYLITDPCPALLDGLVEYKRLRIAGAKNGELRAVIEKAQKGMK